MKNFVRREVLLAITICAGIVVVLVIAFNKEKIGVVRTADLVAEYRGMEDARSLFEERYKEWQSELDSLETDYRNIVEETEEQWNSLSAKERRARNELVAQREAQLRQVATEMESKALAEEERVLQETLGKINGLVKDYAEEHGYDVIYGATIEGSILHSTARLDITDELITMLNEDYEANENEYTSLR